MQFNKSTRIVYCKKKGNQLKSLCPSQFSTQQKELSNASLETKETNFVATEEHVIMQIAMSSSNNNIINLLGL